MIQDILKTLSDTELMAISKQLCDVRVDESLIWAQLVAKSNNGDRLCDLIKEAKHDDFRGTLPRLVSLELSERLLKANQMRNFRLLNPEE
jgi:hypothetical protein